MSEFTMRLGGWQRLWIVISVILLVIFSSFAYKFQKNLDRVEDIAILQQLNKDAVLKAEIPGVGIVEFPNDMEQKDIDRIVKNNFDNATQNQIPIIARELMEKRNQKQAEEARVANDHIRLQNRRTISYAIVGWLGTILGLYPGGWAIGWIYRGFKST
jgi:preprotein translocase subunit SecF